MSCEQCDICDYCGKHIWEETKRLSIDEDNYTFCPNNECMSSALSEREEILNDQMLLVWARDRET